MSRFIILDNLRGIAFILMIIHHIFYFYDVKNKYRTFYSNNIIIKIIGFISRNLFIFLVGYSLVYSYENNKNNFLNNRIKKSLEILAHAFFISLITYYYYPDYYIRFGVLHFIGLITLLLAFITPYYNLYYIIFFIFIVLQYIELPYFNNFIDILLGNNNYTSMDYFSIIKWTPVVLLGMIVKSQQYNINLPINILNDNNLLSWFGQNSLNLYTLHIVIIILFYNYVIK